MKIRVLSSFAHKGEHYEEGESYNLSKEEAERLIAIGRAAPGDERATIGKSTKGEVVTREPKIDNREPKSPKG